MKAKTIVTAITLILATVGIGFAETARIANTGITIDVLPGWKVDATGGRGNLIVIKDKPMEGFQAMINLMAEDLYGKPSDQWLTEYKTGLGQSVKDLHIIKQGPVKLGGVDYLAIEFRGMLGKSMLHWMQVIHIQEGKAWIFTGTCLERYVDIYMPKFQQAFSSIYFPPPPPEEFMATNSTVDSVQLTWRDVSSDETGFVIQRRDAQLGAWADVATVPANSGSYVDANGLKCGTEYRYRIKSMNPRGDSNWSGEVGGTTAACMDPTIIPAPPGDLPGSTPPPAVH